MCFGTTFVVVQRAISDVGPVPFVAVRFLIAALVMAPLAVRRPRSAGILRDGGGCGVSLLAGYLLQTIGLRYTTPSISAFVTALFVVIVPLLSFALFGERLRGATVAGVVVTVAGLALLTAPSGGIGLGVWLTLASALAFGVNVVHVGVAAPRHDPFRLAAVELAVVGAGAFVPGLFLGGYAFTGVAWAGAVFTALAASALAFSLLVWGQARLDPTRTSALLMLEPVTAAVIGYGVGNGLEPVGAVGAVLILAGIVVVERPGRSSQMPPPRTPFRGRSASRTARLTRRLGPRMLGPWPTRRSRGRLSHHGTAASCPAPSRWRRRRGAWVTTSGSRCASLRFWGAGSPPSPSST